jgi:hypothetical protein
MLIKASPKKIVKAPKLLTNCMTGFPKKLKKCMVELALLLVNFTCSVMV